MGLKVKVKRGPGGPKDKHTVHFRYGSIISYDFDTNKKEFEVDIDHLPLILKHCNMELVKELKKAKKEDK